MIQDSFFMIQEMSTAEYCKIAVRGTEQKPSEKAVSHHPVILDTSWMMMLHFEFAV